MPVDAACAEVDGHGSDGPDGAVEPSGKVGARVRRDVFVKINCAATVDGKLATFERAQVRISSDEDMERVHGLRSRFDAIAVGIGTVLADDPKLTSKTGRDPLRVIVDSKARTPVDAEALNSGGPGVIVAASGGARSERVEALEAAGAEVLRAGHGTTDLKLLLDALREREVSSLLVEGGGELNWGFLEEGLVDVMTVFTGGMVFGGSTAPTVVDGPGFAEGDGSKLELVSTKVLGGGVLSEWRVLDG